MREATILVEGQTEEAFVNRVLGPHLARFGVWTTPVLLETSRSPAGVKRGGGVSKWAKVDQDVRRLLGASHQVFVSTMLDYFRLPDDAPGFSDKPKSGRDAVGHIERAIASSIQDGRLVPYLSLHEFEALLFVDPSAVATQAGQAATLAPALRRIVAECGGPEAIDDGPLTAPAKRLRAAWPGFSKVTDAVEILCRIGIAALREECPHFGEWVKELERRAGEASRGAGLDA